MVGSVADDGDLLAAERLQEVAGLVDVEVRVGGLEDDHERVVGDARELREVEERVMVAGQPVEDELAEERAEGGEQDRALVEDGEREDHAPEGLAADDDRVVEGVGVPGEEAAGEEARHAAEQREARHRGAREAHRLVHPVDREGRVDVPPLPAGVADLLGRVVHVGGLAEGAGHAVDAFVAFVHGCADGGISGRGGRPGASPSSPRPWAAGAGSG